MISTQIAKASLLLKENRIQDCLQELHIIKETQRTLGIFSAISWHYLMAQTLIQQVCCAFHSHFQKSTADAKKHVGYIFHLYSKMKLLGKRDASTFLFNDPFIAFLSGNFFQIFAGESPAYCLPNFCDPLVELACTLKSSHFNFHPYVYSTLCFSSAHRARLGESGGMAKKFEAVIERMRSIPDEPQQKYEILGEYLSLTNLTGNRPIQLLTMKYWGHPVELIPNDLQMHEILENSFTVPLFCTKGTTAKLIFRFRQAESVILTVRETHFCFRNQFGTIIELQLQVKPFYYEFDLDLSVFQSNQIECLTNCTSKAQVITILPAFHQLDTTSPPLFFKFWVGFFPFPFLQGVTQITPQNGVTGDALSVFFITENGNLFSFGANSNGQLGLGDTEPRTSPCHVQSLSSVESIYTSEVFVCAVVKSGSGNEIFSWGNNQYNQLGVGLNSKQLPIAKSPLSIPGLARLPIRKLSIDSTSALCLLETGQVYVWGCNR